MLVMLKSVEGNKPYGKSACEGASGCEGALCGVGVRVPYVEWV